MNASCGKRRFKRAPPSVLLQTRCGPVHLARHRQAPPIFRMQVRLVPVHSGGCKIASNTGNKGANMCDQDHFEDDRQQYEALGLVTRKQFGIMLGAGMAMMLPQVANAAAVTESEVNVTTPDGTADCYFVHPSSGTAPGVLVWPDIFGLRPAFRQMGKRLAESGYAVLVVNPFYRTKKAPTADQGAATPIPQLTDLAKTLNEKTHMTDGKAFTAWLDQQ